MEEGDNQKDEQRRHEERMATTSGYEIVWQHLGRYNVTSKIRKTQLKHYRNQDGCFSS